MYKNRNLKISILEEVISAINTISEKELIEATLVQIDVAPRIELGDFSIKCFSLAKAFKKDPKIIADEIACAINENKNISSLIYEARSDGPYVNIKVKSQELFEAGCSSSLSSIEDLLQGVRLMVEYLSPNTNKPLHLGHTRNGVIGMSISKLLEAVGASVIKANLINDRGIHICKSMLAYQMWGENKTPESTGRKGDCFVGEYYTKFEKEMVLEIERLQILRGETSLEKKAQEMLIKWEGGDPDILSLWKTMTQWVNVGFSQTYEALGLQFDKIYYESDTYKLGKDIIKKGLAKGIFSEDEDGSIIFKLPEEDFGTNKDGSSKECTVLRSDGTSVYITQDIGTAVEKVLEFGLQRSIYVVGDEQKYHFYCLFSILNALEYEWADGCYHLAYGMITLPEGKMKSREGKVVDADNLVREIIELAKKEIVKRNKHISEDELEKRASVIGLGAIKFFLLKTKPTDWIEFKPEESISFEGKTGPYCQYAYARISGVISKSSDSMSKVELDLSLLGNKEERALALKMLEFPETVKKAADELDPSILARYLYEISRALNSLYEKHSVLKEEAHIARARYELMESFARILKEGLEILGIEVLEKM